MSETLKQKTIKGIGWTGSVDLVEQILQIIFTAVLARLLTKADFGLVAMAMLVNRFFTTITNVGFGGAIVRSPNVSNGQISAIFYIQLALNIALTAIVFFTANIAANFFNEIKLVEIIRVTSWVILLQTFQFPNILLQRNMDFKRFSLMEISSMLIANITAIILAFLEFGYWALVFRLLLQRVTFGILTWTITKWRPIKPEFNGLKPLIKYGFNMLGAHIVNFFAENMIGIITGKYLGKEIMGLFNIAYNLAIIPATKIRKILTKVLTPGFAKVQDNISSFYNNNKKAIIYTTLVFVPFMFVLSAMSDNLIVTLYGLKWKEAGFMLKLLAFVGIFKGIAHLLRSAILAKGYANIVLYSTIIETVVSLPLMYLLIQNYEIYGLITAYLIGALFAFIYTTWFYDKIMNKSMFFFRNTYKSFITGAIIFFIVLISNGITQNAIMAFTINLISAIFAYVGCIFIFNKSLFFQTLAILKIKRIKNYAKKNG